MLFLQRPLAKQWPAVRLQFDHLVRMFRASPGDISAYLGPGPVLSDDKPSLEYFASLPQDERDLGRLSRDTSAVIRP